MKTNESPMARAVLLEGDKAPGCGGGGDGSGGGLGGRVCGRGCGGGFGFQALPKVPLNLKVLAHHLHSRSNRTPQDTCPKFP